jgi:hypothetical protein
MNRRRDTPATTPVLKKSRRDIEMLMQAFLRSGSPIPANIVLAVAHFQSRIARN